ncbi:MAG: hypothetical protein E7397_01675 [Ruminococcaceae bacterium]|nr:hypothetical protein [Oscillospiraceae bacterium]
MKTNHILKIEQAVAKRVKTGDENHFWHDYHKAAIEQFAHLERWEKAARAMAYAIENQDVYAFREDRIGGRTYYTYEKSEPVLQYDPDLQEEIVAEQEFLKEFPQGRELIENQLIGTNSKGHITWAFERILRLGVSGMQQQYEKALQNAPDAEAEQFYKGVLILLDALRSWNKKHVQAYEGIGNFALAERMRSVPEYPAKNFREAVQAFYMQHLVVMSENPYGGNGPGRLDYYLWPYLERDIKEGRCTLSEAKEIIQELFLLFDERLHPVDGWVEAIVVGGTHLDGTSAVNPLSYLMIEAIMELDVTHPSVYVRLPENPPEDFVKLCAKYMMSGNNRAQLLYDPAVVNALVKNGKPYRDAVEYACGGCMEIGLQGMSSDFLYIGWQNIAKILELMITGGVDLRTGKKLSSFGVNNGLEYYSDFEAFYKDFIRETKRLIYIYLKRQDIYSEQTQKARPSYLISSMIDNCLERGRNMHAGGAKYHDYGGTPLAMPDTADGLYAIKKAVFEEKICTAEELVLAMKANFEGYEPLRLKLRSIPKYGMDDAEADALASQLMRDISDAYLSYRTRWGGCGKPVILTFVYSPVAASILGATADGRKMGKGVAHGITPHSDAMKHGISAAINSCGKMPFEKFSGGASTMWDFDSSWANEAVIEAVIRAFIQQGGQIFQGNTTSLAELVKAKEHPEGCEHLIVRVGGYSARFVNLSKELQDEIIHRMRHCN